MSWEERLILFRKSKRGAEGVTWQSEDRSLRCWRVREDSDWLMTIPPNGLKPTPRKSFSRSCLCSIDLNGPKLWSPSPTRSNPSRVEKSCRSHRWWSQGRRIDTPSPEERQNRQLPKLTSSHLSAENSRQPLPDARTVILEIGYEKRG